MIKTTVTVQDRDCWLDQNATPAITCDENAVASDLQHGHLSVEQALWLHQQGMSWEIHVERSGQREQGAAG